MSQSDTEGAVAQARRDVPAVPGWLGADELESIARERLPDEVFEYGAGGSGDGLTLRANVEAFSRYCLLPRVLRDVSRVTTRTELLGAAIEAPLLVSPMGMQGSFDEGAEAATAAAAAEAGVAFTLSTGASMTIEQVAEAAGQARWFQLYFVTTDRQVIADLVRRAEAAGYTALCVTVDNPVHGFRRWAVRRGGSTRRQGSSLGNLAPYTEQIAKAAAARPPALDRLAPPVHFPTTWDDIRWLRSVTELPIVLKGILHPGDAATAMDLGLQGVFVSNHGGRQVDHGISTLEALPGVAAAVHARNGVVLMDGGVRSATDAAIALALGADAVGLGRPVLWALATGGQGGVSSYLAAFRTELLRTVQLLGLARSADLSAEHVYDRIRQQPLATT